ncbi:MAG: hypothetical protein EPN97_10260 [Alphaproteobacteria bacterium]|nr:MAG: hypothetical protein EPN97_10260 [Alphaproteobacteria bacterium]
MKRIAGYCLAAAIFMASPAGVWAQSAKPEDGVATAQETGEFCANRADVNAIGEDMKRLTQEMNALTESLEDPAQKQAAVKILEHIGLTVHRIREIQEKMDGAASGVMASVKKDVAPPAAPAGKQK